MLKVHLATIVGRVYLWTFSHVQRFLLRRWGWQDTSLRRMARKLKQFFEPLLATTLPNPVEVSGLAIYWLPSACWYIRNFIAGTFEENSVRIFKSLLRPGATVLDLGAHIGLYSLLAGQIAGSEGRVYAFEPDPTVFPVLIRNITANGFAEIIHAEQKAVGNTEGSVKFFLASTQSGYSSIYPAGIKNAQCIEVQMTTLNSFLASEGWPPVDLIKMDIEGSEPLAFQGMKETAHRNTHLKMIVEFNVSRFGRGLEKALSSFAGLESLGFAHFYFLWEREPKKLIIPVDIPWLLNQPVYNILCTK